MVPSSDVVHAFFTKKTIRHISPSEKERSKEENQEKEANSLKRKRIDHLETGEKEITVQDDNSLLVLEFTFIHPSWLIYLKEELKLPYFSNLKRFLTQEKLQGKCIFPPDELIYSWSQLCPLDRVRVVILGQDPYHNIHQAMGLCFSVPKGIKAPPSLINIYKELSSDERIKSKTGTGKFQIPNTGDLTSWAKQGVLLLNTSLTVRAHEAASHADHGWEVIINGESLLFLYLRSTIFLEIH